MIQVEIVRQGSDETGEDRPYDSTEKYLGASVVTYISPLSIRTEVSWPSHCGQHLPTTNRSRQHHVSKPTFNEPRDRWEQR